MVEHIEDCLGIALVEEDIAYERLVIHLNFALTRTNQYNNHSMDADMLEMIKMKYPLSHRCAQTLADEVAAAHGIHLPEEELGYITLHIERLRQRRSEEHTSELQSRFDLVCRLLLEKKKVNQKL